jgi:hypothetical protein
MKVDIKIIVITLRYFYQGDFGQHHLAYQVVKLGLYPV